MLHQTKRVAMEQYEKILTQQLTGDAILTAIVILLFIAISIALYVDWKKHPKGEEKKVIIVTFILATCILVGGSIFGLSNVFKIKKDMDNQDYIIYCGEYSLEEPAKRSQFCYIYTGDERIKLRYRVENFKEGTYNGYIVYAKNSLIVVDRYD